MGRQRTSRFSLKALATHHACKQGPGLGTRRLPLQTFSASRPGVNGPTGARPAPGAKPVGRSSRFCLWPIAGRDCFPSGTRIASIVCVYSSSTAVHPPQVASRRHAGPQGASIGSTMHDNCVKNVSILTSLFFWVCRSSTCQPGRHGVWRPKQVTSNNLRRWLR